MSMSLFICPRRVASLPYSRVGSSGSYGHHVCDVKVVVNGPYHRLHELSRQNTFTVLTSDETYDGDDESNCDTANPDIDTKLQANLPQLYKTLNLTVTLTLTLTQNCRQQEMMKLYHNITLNIQILTIIILMIQ